MTDQATRAEEGARAEAIALLDKFNTLTMDDAVRAALGAELRARAAESRAVAAEEEVVRLATENDFLRASLANGSGPCPYCELPKEDWAKCASGFPGCGRADDAMMCPNVGASLEAEASASALRDRVASLEAELLRLHQDNERLRWRHPTVLPEWNDLPDDMRARLAKAADSFDPEWGAGLAAAMLDALRSGMDNAARAALKESTHVG